MGGFRSGKAREPSTFSRILVYGKEGKEREACDIHKNPTVSFAGWEGG